MLSGPEPAEEFAQELLPLDRGPPQDDDIARNADSDSDVDIGNSHQLRSEHSKPKRTATQRINDSFAWEILMMALSAGILIALVVVLATRDNKPQPDWQYISLNSLISWLTTISRACILFSASEALGQLKWVWFMQREQPIHDLRTFDEASRGPFGALELIWTLRGRHFAVFSSLTIILALGFDPFSQNLVRYHQGSINDTAQRAFMGNTSLYNAYGGPFHNDAFSVEPTLKSNVYNSLFSSDAGAPWSTPRYSCPSTNCTWDPVVSLESRMLCANITNSLVQSCHNVSEEISGRLVNCTASLPKSDMQAWALLNYTKTSFHPDAIHGLVARAVEPAVAVVYTNATRNAFQFIAPWEFKDFWGISLTRQASLWEATECSFEPIIRSFQPAVRNNVYSDKTLAVWSNRTLVRTEEMHAESAYKISNSGSSKLTNDTQFEWQFQPPWGPELGMDLNSPKTLRYGLAAEKAVAKFLRILLTGYYWRNQTNEGFQATAPDAALYASTDVLQTLDRGDLTGCGAPVSYQLSVPGKVNCSMQNIARALSKTLRDSEFEAPDSSTYLGSSARGRVEVNVTFVAVRWQWIALPVFVWVLGAVALAGALWKSRTRRTPRWKNDPLPLLFLYQDETVDGTGNGTSDSGRRWVPNTDRLKVRLYASQGGTM